MSNEEEKRCPLCAEEMDWTDQQLKPCKCGYEVCVWCWHHIMDMSEKDATEGRCPACRTPYDKDKIVGMEPNFGRVVANSSNRKQKPLKAKPKTNEGKKDLSNVRVIQRKMAYIIGLPLSLADEDLLQRKEYFGQYGKVTKISLSRTAGGAIQQFINDTCSVYITYSKEEEAVRCIQSVHEYVLDGRFLRASFGTAKYCHAWLRNMPCNNPACLYLHTVGAEEDSFGKDEVAAVHTRNRVQEIVGAAQYIHKRSGDMLPPPVDEHLNREAASAEELVVSSGLKDLPYTVVTSSDPLACGINKDGIVRSSNQMTTFVDIVGRSCSSVQEKEGNLVEEASIVNLCSNMASVCIDENGRAEAESLDSVTCKSSLPGQFSNGVPKNKIFNEPFREASKPLPLERADVMHNDTIITKEEPCLILDSGRQVLHNPCNTIREHSISFDDLRLSVSASITPASCLIPSCPSKNNEDISDHAWWHTEPQGQSDYNMDRNPVNSYVDEASVHSTSMNSILHDGYNEKKFQSSANSDRIYRSSNSFSNEEIVEHLRRLDDGILMNDDDSAAVENSIISNILSLGFDACDDSTFTHMGDRHGSPWNFHNSDQSGLSFTKQQGFSSQVNDLDSSFNNIGQELKNFSVLQDSGDNKEHYLSKGPQYQVPRSQSLTPPGFSVPSKPPPGFSLCGRTEPVISGGTGNHLLQASMPNNHYRTPSIGNLSNSSDDLIDPAIMVVARGKSTNALNNLCLDTRSSPYAPQPITHEEEAKLWLLMQQSASAHQDSQFSQSFLQQQPPTLPLRDSRYSNQIVDGISAQVDDFYGSLTSRLMDQHQHQHHNPSSFTPYSQPKFGNGHISNGYHVHANEVQQQHRSDAGIQVQRNERLGYNSFFPGYVDYMFNQMPGSGDVYTRVFGT